MRSDSVLVRLDELNRVKISKEFMHCLGLESGDALEFYIEDGCLISKPYTHGMRGIEKEGDE